MKYVISGYNIDNLLKILYQKRVKLFNVSRSGNKDLTFEAMDRDDKKIRRYISNFKIQEKTNLNIRLKSFFKTNVCVIIAVFIGIIFSIYASNYIWQIKIYGANNLDKTSILKVLKAEDVAVGKLNRKSRDEISHILLNAYDRIAQASVIKKGTAIIINISEKLVYEETEFKPIVAKHSGIVQEINLVTGTLNVKVGDYVNVGDSLVLPFNISKDGNKIPVMPMAEIYGNTYFTYSASLPEKEKVLVSTGRKRKVYDYKLWNFQIFSGKSKNSFAIFDIELYNEYISDLIPLKRQVAVYHELVEREIVHDLNREKDEFVSRNKEMASQQIPPNQKVINSKCSVDIFNNTLYMVSTCMCYGKIN